MERNHQSQESREFVESVPDLCESQLVGYGKLIQMVSREYILVTASSDLKTLARASFCKGDKGFDISNLEYFTNPLEKDNLWNSNFLTDEYRIYK